QHPLLTDSGRFQSYRLLVASSVLAIFFMLLTVRTGRQVKWFADRAPFAIIFPAYQRTSFW
ncbi:hypothetical protein JHX08_005910, partial [Klebsiella oxytoca]